MPTGKVKWFSATRVMDSLNLTKVEMFLFTIRLLKAAALKL